MKKLLVMLAAWGCVCLLSTKDRIITPSQNEVTVTAASDTLKVLTYHSSWQEVSQSSTNSMLFISGR